MKLAIPFTATPAALMLTALMPVVIVPAQEAPADPVAEAAHVLNTFTVTSEREERYLGVNTVSMTRVAESIRNTPNTINILTDQFLKDLGRPTSLNEALRFAPGVHTNRPVVFGNQLEIRGETINTNMLDGHLDNVNFPQEMVHIDYIEVLNGPASLLYGRNPKLSGTINKVTRRPNFQTGGFLETQFGSYNTVRVALDATGPVGDHLAYRVDVATKKREFHEDRADFETLLFRGALAWKSTAGTYAELSYQHGEQDFQTNARYWFFNPANGDIVKPRGSFNIVEDKRNFDFEQQVIGLDVFHQFTADLKGRLSARINMIEAPNFNGLGHSGNLSADGRSVTRSYALLPFDNESYSYQADLTWDFSAGRTGHQLLLSAEHTVSDNESNFHNYAGATTLDLLAPVYDTFRVSDLTYAGGNRTFLDQDTYDLTANLSSKFVEGRLKTSMGVKYSKFEFENSQLAFAANGTSNLAFLRTAESDWESIVRVGVVYDLLPSLAAYYSYSEAFQPQTALQGDGTPLPPLLGTQHEVGFKGAFFNEAFNLNLALYALDRDNAFINDPDRAGFRIVQPPQEIQGVELAGNWLVNDRVQLLFSYTYTDAIDNTGQRVIRVPRNQISATARYAFRSGPLEGLSVGLNAYWRDSDRSPVAINAVNRGTMTSDEWEGYDVWNLFATYRLSDRWEFQVNVENLLDDEYVFFTNGQSRLDVAEPRKMIFTARVLW